VHTYELRETIGVTFRRFPDDNSVAQNCLYEIQSIRCSNNSRHMQATLTIFMTCLCSLWVVSSSAHADDAAIKKQLVGSWKGPGDQILVVKENGVMTDSTFPTPGPGAPSIAYWTQRWEIRDGVFHTFFVDKDGKSQKDSFFKIISFTNSKFVIQICITVAFGPESRRRDKHAP
jgi:hypothetical protein